jgi:hypothetical protein
MHTMNRRALVAGAATLPAISLPAIAALPAADPIFAAIEDHRIKDAAFRVAYQDESAENNATVAAAGKVEAAAARTMLLTVPTTLAGIAARVSHVADCESAGDDILSLVMDSEDGNGAAAALLQTLNAGLSQVVWS